MGAGEWGGQLLGGGEEKNRGKSVTMLFVVTLILHIFICCEFHIRPKTRTRTTATKTYYDWRQHIINHRLHKFSTQIVHRMRSCFFLNVHCTVLHWESSCHHCRLRVKNKDQWYQLTQSRLHFVRTATLCDDSNETVLSTSTSCYSILSLSKSEHVYEV